MVAAVRSELADTVAGELRAAGETVVHLGEVDDRRVVVREIETC